MATRAREEDGFGLIELLVALAVLSVGIVSLIGVFTTGIVTIRRAGLISTAAAVADRQMEGFRDNKFSSIAVLTPVSSDSIYTGDTAYSATQVTTATCAATPSSGAPPLCTSSQTITGPDNRSYRVDLYVVYDNSATGGSAVATNSLKKVTIVVRNPKNLSGPVLIRETTNFDLGFG